MISSEVAQIRLYILELIKFTCKRARQHNHDYTKTNNPYQVGNPNVIATKMWAYKFLHDEAITYIQELIWIYRQAGEK